MAKNLIPIGFFKGGKVRELRKQKGMSPSNFAYYIDMSVTHLSNLENNLQGKINVSAYTVAKMAKLFGVALEEIVDMNKVNLNS